MSVDSTTSRVSSTGNGNVDTYSYPFKVFDEADLLVTILNTDDEQTELVLNTDYTVSGVGDEDGGSIALQDVGQDFLDVDGDLLTGYRIVIRRKMDILQDTDITNQGSLFLEVIEQVLDKIVMICLQQQDEIDRSVKLPESLDSSDFDPTLPPDIADNGANKVPALNSSGTGWDLAANWLSTSTIASAITSAAAAAASAAAALASQVAAAASAAAALVSETNAATYAAAAAASATSVADCIPGITGSRGTPQQITAAGGIAFSGTKWFSTWYVKGNGGAIDITANPQIVAGTNVGQKLRIIGRDDANTVKLDDATGLDLNGSAILGASHSLDLEWDGTNWVEVGRTAR